MKLVVWLWNIWKKYMWHKHNIWFQIIDWYSQHLWKYYDSKFCNWKILELDKFLICCKPMTFMNKSWYCVKKLVDYYDISPQNILIIHDEIDFEIWRIQLKFWWSSAWHNWIKSIIDELQTKDFYRLRIWIWRPKDNDIYNYVLSNFDKEQRKIINNLKPEIYKTISDFIYN